MKLQMLFFSCTLFFSYSHPMLRPKSVRGVPVKSRIHILKPAAPQTTSHSELQQLKAQRDAAELQAQKYREEAQFWQQQAQRCQRNGCTKICLAHLKNNCQHAHEEEKQKALQAFYKQQALDHRMSGHQPLKPQAQK